MYLPPFREAVAAGAACMMPAFNEVGGVPSTASGYLMRRVLRRCMGFKGLIVSDYLAIAELVNHGIVPDEAAAAGSAACSPPESPDASSFSMASFDGLLLFTCVILLILFYSVYLRRLVWQFAPDATSKWAASASPSTSFLSWNAQRSARRA